MNRSVSRTAKASPLGSHETTDVSSFLSISISFLGNGLEPELPGDEDAESAGDAACSPPPPPLPALLDDEVRATLFRVTMVAPPVVAAAAASVNEPSLGLLLDSVFVESVLGEDPATATVAGLPPMVMTPATPLPAGRMTAPGLEPRGAGTGATIGGASATGAAVVSGGGR